MSVYYGTVIELTGHGYEARVGAVGASLLSLKHLGRDLILPADPGKIRQDVRGALLAPWPNRIDGGAYDFGGQRHSLPLNEPALANASHGLVAWTQFRVAETTPDRVIFESEIVPQPGYPWRIGIRVFFSLSTSGLEQRVEAHNIGDDPAPFGLAGHPYLVAGAGVVDDWALQIPASHVSLNNDRNLPVEVSSVQSAYGGALDFREPRKIGATVIDNTYRGFDRDLVGISWVRVWSPRQDSGVELSFDASCGFVQVYSHDYAESGIVRRGLAVEPMTCAANAFNSGDGLVVLARGESHVSRWTISALG